MRRAAPVSLLLAVAAVAIVVLSSGPGRYSVTAEFGDVQGLVTGAQVRLAGVPVGEVQRIWLGRDGWPRVELAIDRDVSLRRSATAAVRLGSLSGEFNSYVSIVQGSGSPLARGAVLPRSRTTDPVQFDDALSTFTPATEADLKTILAGLRRSLAGEGSALAATLARSQSAVGEVAGLAGDAGEDGDELALALSSSRTIARGLAGHTSQLDGAVDQSAALLQGLAGRASAIAVSLRGLPQGLATSHATLVGVQRLLAPANRLLDAAAPALAELPATSSELRGALLAARPTLARAATVAAIAAPSAQALMPLLRGARPLLNVMIPVLRRIGPMLDQLRVRFPDAFSFFSNWADFTSNYDANGHGARVGIVVPPAPTNVLSPSSNGPGQLAPPYLRTPGSLEGQPWTDYYKSFVDGGTPGPDVSGSR